MSQSPRVEALTRPALLEQRHAAPNWARPRSLHTAARSCCGRRLRTGIPSVRRSVCRSVCRRPVSLLRGRASTGGTWSRSSSRPGPRPASRARRFYRPRARGCCLLVRGRGWRSRRTPSRFPATSPRAGQTPHGQRPTETRCCSRLRQACERREWSETRRASARLGAQAAGLTVPGRVLNFRNCSAFTGPFCRMV